MLRIGRRGSLSGDLVVNGVQGHVAYPESAVNPLHKLAPVLAELVTLEWDAGNESFPPTSFQLTNLHSGTGFRNVTPGSAELKFNIRYSTEQTFEGLQARIHEVLDRHGLDYTVSWRDAGRPFLTRGGPFLEAVREVVREVAGVDPNCRPAAALRTAASSRRPAPTWWSSGRSTPASTRSTSTCASPTWSRSRTSTSAAAAATPLNRGQRRVSRRPRARGAIGRVGATPRSPATKLGQSAPGQHSGTLTARPPREVSL
jgi:metal-dependent amidase/aminoacylase/carboxypeptidase family protein